MQLSKFNKNKRAVAIMIVFAVVAAVFVLSAGPVLAQASLGLETGAGTGLGTTDLKVLIGRIVQILLGFLGLVAVIIIIYAGYTWMTAAGNSEKIERAKKILTNAVIGLVIMLASFAIVTYVVSIFSEATGASEPGTGTGRHYTINPGALGSGVLQNVYPAPGSSDVPRNTLIMVTYKEEMDPETIIDLSSNPAECNGLPAGTVCGFLRKVSGDPTTRIINRSDDNRVLGADKVVVMTADNRTFTYDPSQYLGNGNATTNYSVNLTDQIDKADGAPAFLIGGYLWSFEVSNELDLTQPQVESVLPLPTADAPKNTTVQITFSEAVNAAGALAQAEGLITYVNENGSTVVSEGTLAISNGFKTLDFTSTKECEVDGVTVEQNSCGLVPTCFPGDEDFIILIKAASVNADGVVVDIFSGISDAAGNSLDGNSNGIPEGQPTDNYQITFSTNDQLDLKPPKLIAPLVPTAGNQIVPKNSTISAIFNEYIKSSSLTSDSAAVFVSACGLNNSDLPEDYNCYPSGGFSVYQQNFVNDSEVNGGDPATKVILRTFYPYLDPLTEYNVRLNSGIQDLNQNCFNPPLGP